MKKLYQVNFIGQSTNKQTVSKIMSNQSFCNPLRLESQWHNLAFSSLCNLFLPDNRPKKDSVSLTEFGRREKYICVRLSLQRFHTGKFDSIKTFQPFIQNGWCSAEKRAPSFFLIAILFNCIKSPVYVTTY